MIGDYFVYLLMTLNAGACVCYALAGAYTKALYWAAVIVLNYCLLRLK